MVFSSSPPVSPSPAMLPTNSYASSVPRPNSAIARPARSSSRMSFGSRQGGNINGGLTGTSTNSKVSDEDSTRTSVKVAVRVRPPLRPSDPGFEAIPQRFQKSMVQVTSPTSIAIDSVQGRKLFVFDKVFGPDVDQDGVWEYLGESVHAFLQGYNVALLAYGQSGAGKSYTMGTSGPLEQADSQMKGVIPRAANEIFEKLSPVKEVKEKIGRSSIRYSSPTQASSSAHSANNKNWTMRASYVEIYNEHLRDLLLPDSVPLADRPQVTIREDTKGRILLTGLQEIKIQSIDDLLSALNFGSSIRQTDSTAINAKSSRSHAVFTLYLVQQRHKIAATKDPSEKRYSAPIDMYTAVDSSAVTVESKFHFVDLAGSERLKNTGAQGDRAKEGISINAGLASLGKVISQLSSRHLGSHVSYRDSKLTRMLQDSLGGNAITYMVACVTPVEFHLSETLNTVQYAQRARAIQSRPKIQELPVEGDLRALVERLRAEISFLRDQIRSSERGNEMNNKPYTEGRERTSEHEVNLQNQVLDLQESYSALSQRHARLISEIAKAREEEVVTTESQDAANNAAERLARSNSFAEAVEQVVLEYEKTIQSLEISLSSTRSTLATTESSLLEHETKIVYMDTINAQLQARVQKLLDRESNTETYLNDLENRLDGQSTGEEKNTAIVTELRRELSRVRENEASCEDYISTLEERLADSDQDTETMQREINKLQTIIERQRSLGKLDNLLHDLDNLAHDKDQHPLSPNEGHVNDDAIVSTAMREIDDDLHHTRLITEQNGIVPNSPQPNGSLKASTLGQTHESNPQTGIKLVDTNVPLAINEDERDGQSVAMNTLGDKLEDVTQELMDLKMEHETTLQDHTELAARYETLLRDFQALENKEVTVEKDVNGEDTLSSDLSPTKYNMHNSILLDSVSPPSMQTLSSELLQAGVDSAFSSARGSMAIRDSRITSQISGSFYSSDEKDDNYRRLQEAHEHLVEEHEAALSLVEELKSNATRGRLNGVISPSSNQILRRKSSQSLILLDRANRSFKNLRTVAMQYLDGHDTAKDAFDANFSGALHELQSRSDRILELEAEIAGLRKDMEIKAAMITGLARERSSINNSPLDISVVSSLENRLAQNESDMQILHKKNVLREQELQREIRSLRQQMRKSQTSSAVMNDSITSAPRQLSAENEETDVSSNRASTPMQELQGRPYPIKSRSEASSSQVDLENSLREAEDYRTKLALQDSKILELESKFLATSSRVESIDIEAQHLKSENMHLQETKSTLEASIKQHLFTITSQNAAVEELKDLHVSTQKDLDTLMQKERKHMDMIDDLEQQLATTYDQHQETNRRLELVSDELEAIRKDRQVVLDESQQAGKEAKTLIDNLTTEINTLQAKLAVENPSEMPTITIGGARAQRSNSVSSQNLRKSTSTASLPSPPPAIPLPPLPGPATTASSPQNAYPPVTPAASRRPSKDYVATHIDDQDARIKTLEKQLQAEKALTATLEEALTDCEKTMKKLSYDKDNLQMKANQAQLELDRTRNESQTSRYSMQAVEDERLARLRAEKAKEALEERMQALSSKKKSRSYACF